MSGHSVPARDARVGTKPHVLILGKDWISSSPGGLNRYLADLLDALRDTGAAVRAVVVGPAPGAPEEVTTASGVSLPLPIRLLRFAQVTARVGRGSDVVDAHFALYAAAPILLGPLRRRPLVVHFQGPWAQESAVARGGGWQVTVKRALERAVYRRADRLVVLSEAFARILVDDYGVDRARIRVIPPGVDLDRFTPGDRARARAALGVSDTDFLVVAARRLDPRMGLDVLLAAWARVQSARPQAQLLIAGDGPERSRLGGLAAALPDPARVRLLGRISDERLVSLYQAADCSVVPTRALEGFGLVVLESLACGTPAVVTDVGGLPDGVVGLDPSLIVPAEDPVALAERLLAAASGRLPSRGECRAHAQTFGWDEVARRHLDLYDEVATPRPRIVYLDHSAQLSGGELALARLLPALDVDAQVILAEDGPLADLLREHGTAVEVLPMPEQARGLRRTRVRPGRLPVAAGLATLGYVLRLARRLRELRPDLVHTNSLKAALYGGVAARLAGVPVVWHVRDRIAEDYLPRPAVRLVRVLARMLPVAIVANSRSTLATLVADGTVIPSPVVPVPVHAGHEGPLRVGIVGRLAPWKGQEVFLEAFAGAFPDGPQIAAVVGSAMFGEDEYAQGLVDQARRLGLDGRVEFRGFREDVTAEYQRLDVLVHASTIPEPFGQVIVEGMAAGLPVLASAAGGPAEIITDTVDGLLYPPGDVDALAMLLRRVADDPNLRARLGARGRARARDFAPDVVGPQVMEVYRRVLRRRRRRHGGKR